MKKNILNLVVLLGLTGSFLWAPPKNQTVDAAPASARGDARVQRKVREVERIARDDAKIALGLLVGVVGYLKNTLVKNGYWLTTDVKTKAGLLWNTTKKQITVYVPAEVSPDAESIVMFLPLVQTVVEQLNDHFPKNLTAEQYAQIKDKFEKIVNDFREKPNLQSSKLFEGFTPENNLKKVLAGFKNPNLAVPDVVKDLAEVQQIIFQGRTSAPSAASSPGASSLADSSLVPPAELPGLTSSTTGSRAPSSKSLWTIIGNGAKSAFIRVWPRRRSSAILPMTEAASADASGVSAIPLVVDDSVASDEAAEPEVGPSKTYPSEGHAARVDGDDSGFETVNSNSSND